MGSVSKYKLTLLLEEAFLGSFGYIFFLREDLCMICIDLQVKDCYLQMEGIVLPPIFSIIKGLQKRIHLDDLTLQGFLQKPAGCSMQKPWALSTMTPHHPNQPGEWIFCQPAPTKS